MGFSPKQYRYIIIGMFLITLLILIEMEYTSRVPTGTFTETPRTISASSCSYLLSTDGNKVYAKNVSTGNIEFSGTLNEVLSFTAKSGNHVCMKNGDYSLSTITLQPNVIIECESNNAIIKAADVFYLIYLKSDSTIKGCTFDHKGKTKTIYVSGEVKNWKVENNYFINSDIAVLVENLNTGVKKYADISNNFPTSGWGSVINNKGLHSKLITMEGTRNIIVTGNYFTDRKGSEFADFNYNVHYVFFDNNTFINNNGFSLSEEAIDMIGGNGYMNSYNTVSNNTIIGNFQSGIRPAKSAIYNTIENNYIEFKKGIIINIADIYLYGGGTDFSTSKQNQIIKNTVIGGKSGIELSGADDNFVNQNTISGSERGISLVNDSFYGATVAPKNNIISQNVIYNINYGIYISSSANNVINNNNITNYTIADIFRE
jgi:parallel beta-helix repeat protein